MLAEQNLTNSKISTKTQRGNRHKINRLLGRIHNASILPKLKNGPHKLDRLSLENLSSLLLFNTAAYWAHS
jgi:hypothetical protein